MTSSEESDVRNGLGMPMGRFWLWLWGFDQIEEGRRMKHKLELTTERQTGFWGLRWGLIVVRFEGSECERGLCDGHGFGTTMRLQVGSGVCEDGDVEDCGVDFAEH